MKHLLTIFIILICLNVKATNRYFANAGNDVSGNGTIGTPYASITKLNSVMASFTAGDSVLFKAGDTFFGKIILSRSDLKFGRYGVGAKPIITGFVTVTGFTSLGGSVWESSAITGGRSTLECVTRNGIFTPRGRYPNASATNGGYLTIDAHTSTSITDASIPSFAVAGAEMVIKTKRYILERRIISSRTSNTINFTATSYAPTNGWGYFIQNSASTLDSTGEWYYVSSTRKLRMYSATSPGTTVKAAVLDTLVFTNSRSNISFSNIQFEGSGADGILITGGSNISTTDCNFFNMGDRAVYNPFENTSIYTSLRDSIIGIGDIGVETNSSKITIESSYVRNVGIFPGMSGSGEGFHANAYAFRHADSNITIKFCNIRNVGMSGIGIKNDAGEPHANNWLIYRNQIDSTNITKDDDGAIYTWGGSTPPRYYNRIIRGNIITHVIGNRFGTPDDYTSGFGIYPDINSWYLRIDSNYIEDAGRAGIFPNFLSKYDTLVNNTLYNNGSRIGADKTLGAGMFFNEDDDRKSSNMVITGNKIWAVGDQFVISVRNSGSTKFAPGVMNNNYYSHLNTKLKPFSTRTSGGTVAKTFQEWRGLGFDTNGDTLTTTSTSIVKGHYTTTDATIDFSGYNWIDVLRATFSNFYNLKAYNSLVVKRTVISGSVPPSAFITTPTNGASYTSPASITINATAFDGDGTIASVKFYNGSTLLNTDLSSPYSYTWTSVAPGTYSLTALATDNEGKTGSSVPVIVTVVNTKPVVSITSPANNATYTTGDPVTINASASDPNGTISKVNFYVDDVFKGTDNSSPYSAIWTSTVGGHSLTAVAVDNNGDSTTSAAVSISSFTTNQPPAGTITLPTKDTTIIGNSASIHFTAVGSDPDGTIVGVRFYDNGVFFWNEATAPWDFTRTISGVGIHNITAVFKDNTGDSTRTAVRKITLVSPNVKPHVSITSPNVDSSYEEPATIPIDVDAYDDDGTITTVHFYVNGVYAGNDAIAPYSRTLTSVVAGGYTLTVTAIDNDGDSTTSTPFTVVVVQRQDPGPDSLSASATITSPILCNGGQATIEVTATGGVEPYTGTGEFTKTGGVYSFPIEDANGLKDTVVVSVYDPGALSLTVSADTIVNYGASVNKTLQGIGGTTPYSYSKDGVTYQTSNVMAFYAGSYTVYVKDANGCTSTTSFTLTQPAPTCNCIIRGNKGRKVYLQ